MAESPPPMTAISLPEKKNPSQVAQEETPWPIRAFSLGKPSHRADAPLATISARVSKVSRPKFTSMGLVAESVFLLAEIDADHMAGLVFSAKASCLLAHVVDEFRALDAVGKTGEVFDQRGEGQLPAGFVSLDDERAEVGASSINGRSQSRTSRADDDDIANIFGHRSRNRFPSNVKDAEAPAPHPQMQVETVERNASSDSSNRGIWEIEELRLRM